jgi:hypothetical protein
MSEPILTITSQEDAVELLLTQDSVRMKLSEHVLQEFRREVEADPDAQAPGWVGSFVRAVTGAAGKLLSSYIEYALYDIESLVERDGTLVFTYRKRHRPSFEDISIVLHGKRLTALEAFTPSDAATFAAQFAALKARTQG